MSNNRQSAIYNQQKLNVGSGGLGVASRGFTLVEALISLGLLTILGTVLSALYVSSTRQYGEESIRAELSGALTTFRREITSELQAAHLIELSYGAYTTGTSTIVIDLPAVDSSGNLLGGGTFVADRVVYTQSGSDILKSVTPAAGSARTPVTDLKVARKITALTFTYSPAPPGSTQVGWTVSASAGYQNRIVTVNESASVRLRNKT